MGGCTQQELYLLYMYSFSISDVYYIICLYTPVSLFPPPPLSPQEPCRQQCRLRWPAGTVRRMCPCPPAVPPCPTPSSPRPAASWKRTAVWPPAPPALLTGHPHRLRYRCMYMYECGGGMSTHCGTWLLS